MLKNNIINIAQSPPANNSRRAKIYRYLLVNLKETLIK